MINILHKIFKVLFLFFLPLLILFYSCKYQSQKSINNNSSDSISGSITIFHAGSLTVPVKIICDSFKKIYPNVLILAEACGSKQCARNITELHKDCDVFISADYKIIDEMISSKHATWNIPFASNEMTITYNSKSRYANEINKDNWYEILLRKDVRFGRSDPNSDPCGVRAIFTTKLSEKYYNYKGLAPKLLNKDLKYIRPKETDLLALLETNEIDYIFLYKSVAMQHNLKYITLPDEINLKRKEMAEHYKSVFVEVNSTAPGEKKIEYGEPMTYGITIPNSVKNLKTATAFVKFFLTTGIKILELNGQPSTIPSTTESYSSVPESLKKFVKKP